MDVVLDYVIYYFSYYVAFVGNAAQQLRNTFIIGDDVPTTDGMGKIFTNPPPAAGVNYYVFIRLYSSINVSIRAELR